MAIFNMVRPNGGNERLFEYTAWNLVLWSLTVLQIVSATDVAYSVTSDCASRWPNCNCNDKFVECHNEKGLTDITDFYHCVEDNVEKVMIVGSRMHELPENTLGSCRHDSSLVLWELKVLDLSSNTIQRIHAYSFHCMPNLETLILAHNEWRIEINPQELGYFASLPVLKHLDLTNAFEDILDGSYRLVKLAAVLNGTRMSELQTLKLAHNEFFSLGESFANSLCTLESLSYLDLSHNNLKSPSLPKRTGCLENLQVLNLSYNQMPSLGREFMKKVGNLKNLTEVRLDNNPYNCDCGLLDTWYWLNSTNLPVNKEELKCASGFHSSYIGRRVLSLEPADLKCLMLNELYGSAANAVRGMILGVIFHCFWRFLL